AELRYVYIGLRGGIEPAVQCRSEPRKVGLRVTRRMRFERTPGRYAPCQPRRRHQLLPVDVDAANRILGRLARGVELRRRCRCRLVVPLIAVILEAREDPAHADE